VQPDGTWLEVFNTGAPTKNSAIDPSLRQPHTDQFVAGVEHQVARDVLLQVQYIGRRFGNFAAFVDTGSAWEPVEWRDPGPDGRPGTADDGEQLAVYRITNPGNRFFTLTNAVDAERRYDGLQLIARQVSSRLQWQVSYTGARARGTASNRYHSNAVLNDLGNPGRFVSPNGQINRDGRLHLDGSREFKALAVARLPWFAGTTVSGIYRAQSGANWGRVAWFCEESACEIVRVEKIGTRRLAPLHLLDVRIEKQVRLRGFVGGVFAEVLNAGNLGRNDSSKGFAVIEQSGFYFRAPNHWTTPRTARAGVRLTF
jgi:hypothetical protein